MIKGTDYSPRRPGLNSQQPCGGSQPSATSVPEDLKPLHRHTCNQNNNIHEIEIKKSFLKKP